MNRRTIILIGALAIVAAAAFAGWPRLSDLRAFDPAGMARLETAMWRDYYEKRYPALFYRLYDLSRSQFGFSPFDSVRIALSAARAARTFQPTRSRQEADAALPDLVTYYGLLQQAALLHDVGKGSARFSAVDRGLTVFLQAASPRILQAMLAVRPAFARRFEIYRDHARIGAETLHALGAHELADVVAEHHAADPIRDVTRHLKRADGRN